ncbi:hypothetical protein PGB90_003621 [Kerria lacca]
MVIKKLPILCARRSPRQSPTSARRVKSTQSSNRNFCGNDDMQELQRVWELFRPGMAITRDATRRAGLSLPNLQSMEPTRKTKKSRQRQEEKQLEVARARSNYSSATSHLFREIEDEIREINRTSVRTGTATSRAREVQLELQSMKNRLEDIRRSVSRGSIREQTRNTSTPDGRIRTISIGSRSTSSSYDTTRKVWASDGNKNRSALSELSEQIAASLRLTADLAAVRSMKPFTDPIKQSAHSFLEDFLDAVTGTALSEVDKIRTFTQLMQVPHNLWDLSFSIRADSFTSKPPLRRNELLIYYDEWHERLSVPSKPRKNEKEIVLELSQSLEYGSSYKAKKTMNVNEANPVKPSYVKRYNDNKTGYKYNTVNNVERCTSSEQSQGNVQSQKNNSNPKKQVNITSISSNKKKLLENVKSPHPIEEKVEDCSSKVSVQLGNDKRVLTWSSKRMNATLFDPQDPDDPRQPNHDKCCWPRKSGERTCEGCRDNEKDGVIELGDDKVKESKFKLGDLELIKDLTAYRIARVYLKGSERNVRDKPLNRYFSTFEFISIDYLAARVARYNREELKILLSTGLSDQMLQHKVNINQYELNLDHILKSLVERGTKLIVIIMPPPHPRMASLIQFEFYAQIRTIVRRKEDFGFATVKVLNLDHLFFEYNDGSNQILSRRDDGTQYVSISIYYGAFKL